MEQYSGYTTYYEDDSKKIKKLDNAFLACVDSYKIHHWEIPAMISGNILKRCGYFSTLPQQLTKISTIDRSRLTTLACGCECNLTSSDYDSSSSVFLTPAACLHFYPMLEKKSVYNEIVTTLARVYRYEEGHFIPGVRQWDFAVREFVAVGSESFVREFLSDMETKLYALANSFNGLVSLKNANDHFYPSKMNDLKERFQKSNSLKKELLVNIGGTNVAIASFNYHGLHFSKEFNFDKKGKIVTGCVGCGIDRWVKYVNNNKSME